MSVVAVSSGNHCLIIYLTCAIPVTLMQRGLIASGKIDHAGLTVLATAVAAVALSLAFHRLVRRTPLNLLYLRTMRLHIKSVRFNRSSALLPPPPRSPGRSPRTMRRGRRHQRIKFPHPKKKIK